MCGNLGLLLLRQRSNTVDNSGEKTRRKSSIVDDFTSREHAIALMEIQRLGGSRSLYECDDEPTEFPLGYDEGW